jgi:hypothetical protein
MPKHFKPGVFGLAAGMAMGALLHATDPGTFTKPENLHPQRPKGQNVRPKNVAERRARKTTRRTGKK